MRHPLRIVGSCGEPWDAMTPRAGGRHCARCDRVVVDLRGMSRAEALARVERIRRELGSVCGRATVDAETKALVFPEPPARPRPRRGVVHGALLAAALASGCDRAAHDARAPAPAALLSPLPARGTPDEAALAATGDALPPPPPLPGAGDAGAPCVADGGGREAHARRTRRHGHAAAAGPPPVVEYQGFLE